MRSLFLLATAGVSLSASAQTSTLVGTYQGKEVGSATFSYTAQRDRSFIQHFILNLELSGRKLEAESTTRITGDGETLKSEDKETVNGTVGVNVSVQFNLKGAVVTDKATGSKKDYPAPKGTNRKDISDLWFVMVKPKLGAKVTATTFSSDKSVWQVSTTSYTDDKSFKIAGKTVVGHHIKHVSAGETLEAYVDDHGLPLEFELPGVPGLKFVRK